MDSWVLARGGFERRSISSEQPLDRGKRGPRVTDEQVDDLRLFVVSDQLRCGHDPNMGRGLQPPLWLESQRVMRATNAGRLRLHGERGQR